MRNEFRYALRAISRERGLALIVVLSLALGIGANTAIFSLVNSVLLRPPAYAAPERLASMGQVIPEFLGKYPALPVSVAFWKEWQRQCGSFEGIAIMNPAAFNLTGVGNPEMLRGAQVSANAFRVLGVQPRLGRGFQDGEDEAGRERVVMISDGLWRRSFQADPGVVGRKVLLDGAPHEVVGVLPASFRYPRMEKVGPMTLGDNVEIYRPLGYSPDALKLVIGEFNYSAVGRLRPGVSIDQAAAELEAVQKRISALLPEKLDLHGKVTGLQEQIVGRARGGLTLLMAAVGAVLLALCVNLANLLLAYGAGKQRDSAIRTALGASRARLVWQSMMESGLLSIAGGALGIALAYWGLDLLLAAAPMDLPRLSEVRLDARALLFAVAVSVGAGMLFGVLPALRNATSAPFEALKSGSRGSTEARAGVRLKNALVAFEVGLSAMLLVAAGLLVTSFVRVLHVDKGFDAERVLAIDLRLPAARYGKPEQRASFYQRTMEQVSALPGVTSTGLVSTLPLGGENWIDIMRPEGDHRALTELPSANVRFISPRYFETLRVPLKEGRAFQETDRERAVAIISANVARTLWPGQSAVGRKIEWYRSTVEVVGVTPDLRAASLEREPVNMFYVPYWTRSRLESSLLVRTAADPRGLSGALRRVIWNIDSEVPLAAVRTLEEVVSQSVAARRFQTALVFLFAASALALAGLGAYGVLSYAVARRRAEMGVRMALGAQPGQVLRMVLAQGMKPVWIGLGAGCAAAFLVARYLESQLFQVSARDPLTFALAAAVLLFAAFTACLIPARRATRVDPLEALRFE
jgi:predicted permease